MRIRTKRAVPETQLPLPFTGRMRVAKQLTLPEPEPEFEPAKLKPTWPNDLEAVQRGALSFEKLVRRHRALIRTMVRPWLSRCPPNFGADDVMQEVLLAVWVAISKFDPQRGVPLRHFVRLSVQHKLKGLTHKLIKRADRDVRFLTQQIVEEKVVVLNARMRTRRRWSDDESVLPASYEAVVPPENLELFDAARVAALVVGGLPSKQARVVVGIVLGEAADSVTSRVYGNRCLRPRKAALRAYAAAEALVESVSSGGQPQIERTEHVAHQITASTKDSSTGLEATSEAHAGSGQ